MMFSKQQPKYYLVKHKLYLRGGGVVVVVVVVVVVEVVVVVVVVVDVVVVVVVVVVVGSTLAEKVINMYNEMYKVIYMYAMYFEKQNKQTHIH